MKMTNKLLLFGGLLFYVFCAYIFYRPALSGFHSSNKLQEEVALLTENQEKAEEELKNYAALNLAWGDQLILSEESILTYVLSLTDSLSIHLVDFSHVEESQKSISTPSFSHRYRFEVRANLYKTLTFLNALEQQFPFATIVELQMSKKRIRRETVLQTRFYIQQ